MSVESPRCKGRSKQRDAPCGNAPIPFGEVCRFHGGNNKAHREKARKAMLEYERWSPDPWYIKQERLKSWRRSNRRWEMRKAKKRGPEYVAALKREQAAEKAESRRWAAENARARAEQKRAYREDQRPSPSPSEAAPFDPLTYDWMG